MRFVQCLKIRFFIVQDEIEGVKNIMYIIVGANGFLGSYIIKNIINNTNENILAVCRNINNAFMEHERIKWLGADISNNNDILKINKFISNSSYPCKVIWLAAVHHPDAVEQDFRKAWHVNITCLSSFLEHSENMKCFFYPSSDVIYGDGNFYTLFTEEDIPSPINSYGKQKAAAESIVLCFGGNIVRYPFLISPSLLKHKEHFYDVIVNTLKAGKKIEMLCDSMRSTIDFDTAGDILIRLTENYSDDVPKILNICGDKALSKYDIGLMIAEKHGLNKTLVQPINFSSSTNIFKTKRSQSALMNNSKVKKILNLHSIQIKI